MITDITVKEAGSKGKGVFALRPPTCHLRRSSFSAGIAAGRAGMNPRTNTSSLLKQATRRCFEDLVTRNTNTNRLSAFIRVQFLG